MFRYSFVVHQSICKVHARRSDWHPPLNLCKLINDTRPPFKLVQTSLYFDADNMSKQMPHGLPFRHHTDKPYINIKRTIPYGQTPIITPIER